MTTNNPLLQQHFVSLILASALVVSACGNGTTQPDPGDVLAPTPIHVSNTGGPQSGVASTDPAALAEGAASDEDAARLGMTVPWMIYDFTVGAGMPALPTQANGWQYSPDAVPDLSRIAQIAAALGVSGDPVKRPADQGGGWMVGPDNGSAPALWVSADSQLSWWFSAPYTGGSRISRECATATEIVPASEGDASDSSTGGTPTPAPIEECVVEEPLPPTGILTADQARSRATDLLAQMGANADLFELEVYADEWYASVSAQQRLGSNTSPVGWYFGFGAEGRLESGGGLLAQPQEVGPYPLIDIDTALDRLRNGYFGGIMPLAVATPALDAPVVSCEAGADCTPIEPEHIQVALTGMRQDLWMAWESDGTVWLLPAFTFLDANGGRYTVPAVTDEYLIMDDFLGDSGVDDPAAPASDVTDLDVVISDSDAAVLVGLSEDEALATAADYGWTARVVVRDGEQLAVTEDYSTSRVNLTITEGTVTAVTVG